MEMNYFETGEEKIGNGITPNDYLSKMNEDNRKKKKKILGKMACLCGRKVIVDNRNKPGVIICGTCKAIGFEKSKEEYLSLKRNNFKTKFEIGNVLEKVKKRR